MQYTGNVFSESGVLTPAESGGVTVNQ